MTPPKVSAVKNGYTLYEANGQSTGAYNNIGLRLSTGNVGTSGTPFETPEENNPVKPEEKPTKRSEEELFNAINTVFIKRGLIINKEVIQALFSFLSDLSIAELLDAEDTEIQKIVKKLDSWIIDDALKSVADMPDGPEKQEALNKALVRSASDYRLVESFGSIDIDKFGQDRQNNRAESLGQRIARYYDFSKKKLDWNTLTREQKLGYIERYFTGHFEKDDSNTQINDFIKLLANTPEEEQALFLELAPKLLAENRCNGALSVLKSQTTDEGRNEIAFQIWSDDYVLTLMSNPDNHGNYVNPEEAAHLLTESAICLTEEQHGEILEAANHAAQEIYTTDNNERYAELKKRDKSKLSKEEIEFIIKYEYQSISRPAQIIGAANSEIIEDEDIKNNLVDLMNNNAYEYAEPIYYDIIRNIANYAASHPETLNMTLDEFNNLMKEIIKDNYSTILNDIENGTVTELTPPQKPADSGSAGTETVSGNSYPNNHAPTPYFNQYEMELYIAELKSNMYGQDDNDQLPTLVYTDNAAMLDDNNYSVNSSIGRTEFVKQYKELHGCSDFKATLAYYGNNIIKFVTNVFDDDTLSNFKTIAESIVNSFDEGLKEFIIGHTNSTELAKAIIKTSPDPEKYNGEFVSADVKECIKNAMEPTESIG